MIVIPEESMPQSLLVSILGAMHALYTNIELREAVPEKAKKAEGLGVWSSCAKQMQVCLRFFPFSSTTLRGIHFYVSRSDLNFRQYHLQSSLKKLK